MMRPSPSAVITVRLRHSHRPSRTMTAKAPAVSAKRPLCRLGAQQRIGNARIFRKDHIEERRQTHRLMLRNAIDVDQPELIGLIEDERDQRREKSDPARLHAKSPSAFNSRKAWHRAGSHPGNSGSLPTSGDNFHERAHLRPCARAGTTATPGTSGEAEGFRRPFARHDLDIRGDADLRRSRCHRAERADRHRRYRPAARLRARSRSSCCARSISSAPVTTERICRIVSHLAASASSRQAAGMAGKASRCTERASG